VPHRKVRQVATKDAEVGVRRGLQWDQVCNSSALVNAGFAILRRRPPRPGFVLDVACDRSASDAVATSLSSPVTRGRQFCDPDFHTGYQRQQWQSRLGERRTLSLCPRRSGPARDSCDPAN